MRVMNGRPQYGRDIRERDLPQETGQERALDFNKGCYIGQEIVERIRSRGNLHRRFSGFVVDGPVPDGTKIQLNGKDVGELTSVETIFKPGGGITYIALGYIRREAAEPGSQTQANGINVRPSPSAKGLIS